MLAEDGQPVEANGDAPRDFFNIAVGTAWQLTLVTIPLYLVFRDMRGLLISVSVFVVTTVVLKKTWYDRLETDEIGIDDEDVALPASPAVEPAGR